MSPLLARLLAPALGLALAAAMASAAYQALQAADARTEQQRTATEFATYRETMQKDALAASVAARAKDLKTRHLQQEALDAEYLARTAAQADAARLRDAGGQLQRYATDLATSLDRASTGDLAAASCSSTAPGAGRLLANMLGRIDSATAELATFADASRRAGQLCERNYDALTQPIVRGEVGTRGP